MQILLVFFRYPKAFAATILILALMMTAFDSVRATTRTDEEMLDQVGVLYAICSARVEADLNDAETKITTIHLVFGLGDSELVQRAELTAIFYKEDGDRSAVATLKSLPGDRLGFQFKPENGLTMEVTSPMFHAPVKFRLYEPYRSREPAINDLRFVPD